MNVRALAMVVASLVIALPSVGRATEIETLDHATWDQAVRAVERDVASEGRSLQVVVRDDQREAVPCGRYRLQLDAVGTQAFRLGVCDEQTRATDIQLVRRDALFAPAEPVPRPLEVELRATVSQDAVARGGGGPTGGRELRCVASVEPYLQDLQHGTHVALIPGRYLLRTLSREIRTDTAPSGWMLSGPPAASARVEYEVVDTQRNETVLHDETTLACRDVPVRADATLAELMIPHSFVPPDVSRRIARARLIGAIAPALGPSLAGTVFLALGVLLHNEAPSLSLTYEIIGPVMLTASAAVLIGCLVHNARSSHSNPARADHRGAEFVALSVAPVSAGNGAVAAAAFRF